MNELRKYTDPRAAITIGGEFQGPTTLGVVLYLNDRCSLRCGATLDDSSTLFAGARVRVDAARFISLQYASSRTIQLGYGIHLRRTLLGIREDPAIGMVVGVRYSSAGCSPFIGMNIEFDI